MCIASVGFITHGIYFLLFVLFCLGAQATFFGPIKYALLPQHLQEGELIAGNAYIESGTFLAILLGTIAGGLLILYPGGVYIISAAIVLFALAGYICSRKIPAAPAPMHELVINWNMFSETLNIINHARGNRRVFMSILGISWFWLVGATFLSQFPTYAKDIIHGDQTVVTLFLTVFSVGIGVGSMLCNRLVKGKVSSAYVPLGAIGITLFTVDLFFASRATIPVEELLGAEDFLRFALNWRIIFDLFAVAVSGGVYIVPLYAIMQHYSDPDHRARTIASNNVLNALFMVTSAIGTVAMLKLGFSVPQVFLTVAVLNGAVALAAVKFNRRA
jgi:acyl-[acyl-carrier-protein]-phospholipid O-acyltransferase / long-chain-fatty-acid--[acyl-carrier-protein] ligase